MNEESKTYVALLRGINVGGHHKVPMADLKKLMAESGFSAVKTLLNSGNVVFTAKPLPVKKLEQQISAAIEQQFGFPVPVLVRPAEALTDLVQTDPFRDITVTPDTRLYVTFLSDSPADLPEFPNQSDDRSFVMLGYHQQAIISVLDLSHSKTVEAMVVLEKLFGKNVTTRNWNTVLKLEKMIR